MKMEMSGPKPQSVEIKLDRVGVRLLSTKLKL